MTVESKHRHDYKTCGCPNEVMVDGGLDYLRGGAVDFSLVEAMHLVEENGPTMESSGDQWTDSSMTGDSNG